MNRPTSLSASHVLPVEQDPRWAVLQARDPAADANFVYAVKTTGVYCRPGGGSRLPRPENIEFFDSPEAAEAAGYRPSRRGPIGQAAVASRHAALIAQACRDIESTPGVPRLHELAERAGMSLHHFHRVFKSVTGLTPRAYASALRASQVRERLDEGASVTTAIYEAGFGSGSRFYESSSSRLGMQPRQYRAGGVNARIRFAVGQCSLGAILVAQSERGICAISIGDDAEELVRNLQDQFPRATLIGGDAGFEQTVATVVGFVESPSLGLGLPLDVRGTVFQERVWQALRDIPFGRTVTYADIARQLGVPGAVRAVANACGANRLAVAIPCHRVVRSDGSLSGYRWGVERKRQLLEREAKG